MTITYNSKNPFLILLIFGMVMLLHTNIDCQETPSKDTLSWSIDLDKVIVTAQYAPTSSKNAVHKIRSIGLEEIKQRGVDNLEQLLNQELNIRIAQDLILGSSLNLQGTGGQNIQIMIDGIPIIGRVGDNIDLGQVNLHNIERVEIVEGPLSVNYGTNALGGVINLISKKSQLKKYEARIESLWEQIGRLNLKSSLGFWPTDNLLFKVHGAKNQFDGSGFLTVKDDVTPRALLWNPKDQLMCGSLIRYNFLDDHKLSYTYNWFNEQVTNLGPIRRPQFKPYAFDDYYKTSRQDHAIHHEGSLKTNYYLQTSLAYNYFERNKNTFRFNFDDNEEIEEMDLQDTAEFNTIKFKPVIASKFKNAPLNFQIGADISFENTFGKRINDVQSKRDNYSELNEYAIFGSIQYNPISLLAFQLGARAAYNTRFEAPIVPSLNIKYTLYDDFDLRASYAKGFRTPSLKELFYYFVDANHIIYGNTELKAETSDNFQIGLDWRKQYGQHQLSTSLSTFYNDIKQKIDLYDFVLIDGKRVPAVEVGKTSTQYAYFNQDRYKTVGTNLRLEYAISNFNVALGFSPIGRYNILSETQSNVDAFTFVYETNGKLSYSIPKYLLNVSLYVRNNDKLVRYFLDVDDDGNSFANQTIHDGYTLADFSISKYFWHKRVFVSSGINNIFDVQNIPFSGNGGGSIPINIGRSGFIKIALNLDWD